MDAPHANARGPRNRGLLRSFGPGALLLLCVLNLWWSRVGRWGVSIAGLHYSRGDSITVIKGLFSQDGRLYFANSCKSGIYSGLRPSGWENRPVTVQTFGLRTWFHGPVIGENPRNRGGVWTDEWERSGVARLGFVATWQGDIDPTAGFGPVPQRGFAVPWWFLVAVFSLTPIRDVLGYWRTRWARAAPGAKPCPVCRYDLRATPDRCPECGHAL
jgi:hypothetical protein